MKTENKKKHEKEHFGIAAAKSNPISARGRVFQGIITKKFPKRIVLEFERIAHIPKYERFYKKKTRIHARLPEGMSVEIGDHVKVQECRPLSKIIHHIVIGKIKNSKESKK